MTVSFNSRINTPYSRNNYSNTGINKNQVKSNSVPFSKNSSSSGLSNKIFALAIGIPITIMTVLGLTGCNKSKVKQATMNTTVTTTSNPEPTSTKILSPEENKINKDIESIESSMNKILIDENTNTGKLQKANIGIMEQFLRVFNDEKVTLKIEKMELEKKDKFFDEYNYLADVTKSMNETYDNDPLKKDKFQMFFDSLDRQTYDVERPILFMYDPEKKTEVTVFDESAKPGEFADDSTTTKDVKEQKKLVDDFLDKTPEPSNKTKITEKSIIEKKQKLVGFLEWFAEYIGKKCKK